MCGPAAAGGTASTAALYCARAALAAPRLPRLAPRLAPRLPLAACPAIRPRPAVRLPLAACLASLKAARVPACCGAGAAC